MWDLVQTYVDVDELVDSAASGASRNGKRSEEHSTGNLM
jgi:hypothetical protein